MFPNGIYTNLIINQIRPAADTAGLFGTGIEDQAKVNQMMVVLGLADLNFTRYEAALLRSEDFEAILYKAFNIKDKRHLFKRFISVEAQGVMDDPAGPKENAFLTALRLMLRYIQGRGRFLKELGDTESAQEEFELALQIYNTFLYGRRPSPFAEDAVKEDFFRYLNSEQAFFMKQLNGALFHGNTSLTEEYLGLAGTYLSSAPPEFLVDPTEVITTLDLDSWLEQNEALRNAKNAYKTAMRYKNELNEITPQDLDRAGAPGGTYPYLERAKRRIKIKEKETWMNFEVTKANYLLKLARRLRIKNHKLAKEAAEKAIGICLYVLAKNPPATPPDIMAGTIMTLAWAFNTMANLLEDKEPGSGKAYAQKSIALYKHMLYGGESLDDESGALKNSISEKLHYRAKDINTDRWVEGDISVQDILKNIVKNKLSIIAESLKNVEKGLRYKIWIGLNPYLPGTSAMLHRDVLQTLTTNELVLKVSFADSLILAKRYDEAIAICERCKDLRAQNAAKLNAKGKLFLNAKITTCIAQAKIRKAMDIFFENGDYKHAYELIVNKDTYELLAIRDKVDGTIKEVLEEAIKFAKRLKEILPKIPEKESKRLQKYFDQLFKLAETLAWAYTMLGVFERALNYGGNEYFERARVLHNSIHYFKDDKIETNLDSNDKVMILAELIESLTRSLNEKALTELKVITNLSDANLIFSRAEDLKNMRNFAEALELYKKLDDHDPAYSKSQIATKEAEIEKVKDDFKADSNRVNALNVLLAVVGKCKELLWETTDRTLRYRLIASLAWAYSVAGNIESQYSENLSTAQEYFSKAAAIYRAFLDGRSKIDDNEIAEAVSELRGELINGGKLTKAGERIFDELNLTLPQLRTTLADLLKAAGKRDFSHSLLKKSESEYAAAIKGYKKILETDGSNRVAAFGIAECKTGIAETKILRSKIYNFNGKEDNAESNLEKATERMNRVLSETPTLFEMEKTNPKLLFRVLSSTSWAHSAYGGLVEELFEIGEGRESFLIAMGPYIILLASKDPILKEALKGLEQISMTATTLLQNLRAERVIDEEFLIEAENAEPKLKYTLAALLKSAGKEDEEMLQLALSLYKDVEKIPESKLTKKLGKRETEIFKENVKLGIAETKLTLAEILPEEEDEEIGKLYKEAIEICLDILSSGKDIDPKVTLTAILDLAWAYSSKGGFFEDIGEESDSDFALGAALLVALLYGSKRLKKEKELLRKINPDDEIGKKLLNILTADTSKIDPALLAFLFEVETPEGKLHARLAGLLGALEEYKWAIDEVKKSDKKYLSIGLLALAGYKEEAIKKYEEFLLKLKVKERELRRKGKVIGPKFSKIRAKLTYELADVLFWGLEDYKESMKFLKKLVGHLKVVIKDKGMQKWTKLLILKTYLRFGQMHTYWDTPLRHKKAIKYLRVVLKLALGTHDPDEALEKVRTSKDLGRGVKEIIAQASSVLESIYGDINWSRKNMELKKKFHKLATYCVRKKKTRINIANTTRKTEEWHRLTPNLNYTSFSDKSGRKEQNAKLRISYRPQSLESLEFSATGVHMDINDPLGKIKEVRKSLLYTGATYYHGGVDKFPGLLSVGAEAKIGWAKEHYRYLANSHLTGDVKLNYKNQIQGELKYGYNKELQDNIYGSLLLSPLPFFNTQWGTGFTMGYEYNRYPFLKEEELTAKSTHTYLFGYMGMLKDAYGRVFLGAPLTSESPVSFTADIGIDIIDLVEKFKADLGIVKERQWLKFIQSVRVDLGGSLYIMQKDRYYFNEFRAGISLGFGK